MTPKNELLFCALGGSGEIGMNVNLYGCNGKWVMVDLGITFADPQYPGVDVILPDLSFIEERIDDLVGIVITHGHEDHIGSLPYLAEDLGVPIYATPFTMGLIRGKLEEDVDDSRGVDGKIGVAGRYALDDRPIWPERERLGLEARSEPIEAEVDCHLGPVTPVECPVVGNRSTHPQPPRAPRPPPPRPHGEWLEAVSQRLGEGHRLVGHLPSRDLERCRAGVQRSAQALLDEAG